MGEAPYLSLIVPAYNEAKQHRPHAGGRPGLSRPPGFDYEIIVAADGDDGTREIVGGLAPRRPPADASSGSAGARAARAAASAWASPGARRRSSASATPTTRRPIEEFDKLLPLARAGLRRGHRLARHCRDSRIERPQPLYRRLGSRAFALRHARGRRPVGSPRHAVRLQVLPRRRWRTTCSPASGSTATCSTWRSCTWPSGSGYRIKEVGVRWRDDGDSRLGLVSGNWQQPARHLPHPLRQVRPGHGPRRPRPRRLPQQGGVGTDSVGRKGCQEPFSGKWFLTPFFWPTGWHSATPGERSSGDAGRRRRADPAARGGCGPSTGPPPAPTRTAASAACCPARPRRSIAPPPVRRRRTARPAPDGLAVVVGEDGVDVAEADQPRARRQSLFQPPHRRRRVLGSAEAHVGEHADEQQDHEASQRHHCQPHGRRPAGPGDQARQRQERHDVSQRPARRRRPAGQPRVRQPRRRGQEGRRPGRQRRHRTSTSASRPASAARRPPRRALDDRPDQDRQAGVERGEVRVWPPGGSQQEGNASPTQTAAKTACGRASPSDRRSPPPR